MQQNNEPEKVIHRKLMDAYGNFFSPIPYITFQKKRQESSTKKFWNDFLKLLFLQIQSHQSIKYCFSIHLK